MRGLVERIIKQGQSMGVECFGSVQKESIYNTLDVSLLDKSEELGRALEALKSGPLSDIVFLFCIVDDTKERSPLRYLGNLVRLCETDLGWLTGCFHARHTAAATDEHLRTIALKINAKLGGTNTALRDDFGTVFRYVFRDQPVILFGTDVPRLVEPPLKRELDAVSSDAYLKQRARAKPAVDDAAAVVASVDWPHPSQYCARVIPNPDHNLARVSSQTSLAIGELVELYAEKNGGRRPERAVFFRQHAGSIDPANSPDDNLVALKTAPSTSCPQVKATWVDVQRGHHTKLFVDAYSGAADVRNVETGTVVDSGVVHPWQWDFYLASHCATSSADARVLRPTYYRVVEDENKFTADEMEKFLYYLCHTFAAPTETTEMVPPLLR